MNPGGAFHSRNTPTMTVTNSFLLAWNVGGFSTVLHLRLSAQSQTNQDAWAHGFSLHALLLHLKHTHTFIHTHACTLIHIHAHVLIYIQAHTHTHTLIHTCMYTHTHTYTHAYIHTSTDTHKHSYTHMHTYSYTCRHTHNKHAHEYKIMPHQDRGDRLSVCYKRRS